MLRTNCTLLWHKV